MLTLHTTLPLDSVRDAAALAALDDWAEITGRCQRALHAGRMKGKTHSQLKPGLMVRFGLTARQFNGLRVDYDGKLRAARTGQTRALQRVARQIARNTERLAYAEHQGNALVVHQLKRRGAMLEARQAQATASLQQGVSLCFGSAKLFRAQRQLAANGFANHAQWQQAWRSARSSQIPLVGSKDETAGNQTAQYNPVAHTVTLRLPQGVATAHGLTTRLVIPGVVFRRDPAAVQAALVRGTAMSYRLVREAVTTRAGNETGRTRWRVFLSFEQPAAVVITDASKGAVGVDMNVDHLAWCRIDASRNPVAWGRIPLAVVGLRKAQVRQRISDAVAPLVEMAARHGVPLIHEDLDLTAKADQRRGRHRKTNRTLSSFATNHIVTLLISKALRLGVETREINPAYTSIIGGEKYATGYGRSRHQAAACVIARRGVGSREHPAMRVGTPQRISPPQHTRPRPVRTRGRHVWKDWAVFARQLATWEARQRALHNASGGASKATHRRRTVRRSRAALSPTARVPARI